MTDETKPEELSEEEMAEKLEAVLGSRHREPTQREKALAELAASLPPDPNDVEV